MSDVNLLVCILGRQGYSNFGLACIHQVLTLQISNALSYIYCFIIFSSNCNKIVLRSDIHSYPTGIIGIANHILSCCNIQIGLLDNSNILADFTICINRYLTCVFQRSNRIFLIVFSQFALIRNRLSSCNSIGNCCCCVPCILSGNIFGINS